MSESIKRRTGALSTRSDAKELKKMLDAALADLTEVRSQVAALVVDITSLRTSWTNGRTGLINMALGDAGCAIGSTATKVKTAATITYIVNGVFCALAATDDFWTLTGFNVTAEKTNKCLLCVEAGGTAAIAVGTEGASAGAVTLPSIPASYAVIGMLQVAVTGSGVVFTGGTTQLSAAGVTDTYYDLAFHPDTFAAPAALTASSPAALTLIS